MIRRGPWLIHMDADICAEWISAVALASLCYANLRTPIDSVVTASDASESGAGVVRSVCLSPVGLQMVASFNREGMALASEHLGLVSLFDGIGGARRALEILDAAPACTYCSEIDPACVRVVDSSGPGFVTWATCARSTGAHGGACCKRTLECGFGWLSEAFRARTCRPSTRFVWDLQGRGRA